MQNYHPTKTVLDSLRDVQFVGVVGPTGAGKTTIINKAATRDPQLHLIVSDTTRPPRPGERDGVDYHFRAADAMRRDIAERLYVNVAPSLNGTDMYATHPDNFPHNGVGVMALFAQVVAEFRSLPFASCTVVYIVPPDAQTWLTRAGAHHFTPAQKTKRFEEAIRSLQFACEDIKTLFVINDDLATATDDFIALAHHHPLTMRQQQDQVRGRQIAHELRSVLTAK
jgi:guanylate kinase